MPLTCMYVHKLESVFRTHFTPLLDKAQDKGHRLKSSVLSVMKVGHRNPVKICVPANLSDRALLHERLLCKSK